MKAGSSTARDLHALAGLSQQTLLPVLPRPRTMRALELRAYDGVSLVFVSNKLVPVPGPGEVLVRVHTAPISAADLLFLQGRLGSHRPLPVVPGLECSGVVVGTGGGLMARALLGRRVACGAPERGDGTWAEYVCVPFWRCVPLRSFTDFEQGASLLHNAISAWALVEAAKARGARAIAHTAGTTPLGRMLTQLGARRRLPMLHIVEDAEQAAVLRELGGTHILDTSAGMSAPQLATLFAALGVNIVLEANAGVNTDALLRALPPGGSVLVHGAQPDSDCTLDPTELIFNNKRIEGFLLQDWMKHAGFARSVQAGLTVQRILHESVAREPRPERTMSQPGNSARLPLDSYHHALDLLYRGKLGEGQVQFQLVRAN